MIELYTIRKIDTDFTYYRVSRNDVKDYLRGTLSTSISRLVSFYDKLIKSCLKDDFYYIRYNIIYFTYLGTKYSLVLSRTSIEWDFIDYFLKSLSYCKGVTNVCYMEGDLD